VYAVCVYLLKVTHETSIWIGIGISVLYLVTQIAWAAARHQRPAA
jgi:hypothetical protein